MLDKEEIFLYNYVVKLSLIDKFLIKGDILWSQNLI